MKSFLFYKYFFSYLFVFSIPVIILGFMIYQNAIVNLRHEIESSNLTKLNQVKDIMDMQYHALENTAIKISFNPRLTPFMIKAGGFYSQDAIQEISKYKGDNPIVEEIFLFFRGDDVIYSSLGSSTLQTLTTSIYKIADKSRFIDEINTLNLPSIESIELGYSSELLDKKLITYVFPIRPNSAFHYGSVVFLVDEQKMEGLIDNILGDLAGAVLVMNGDGEIMISTSHAMTEDTIPQVGGLTSGISALQHQGQSYSVAKVHSELTGWSFFTILPDEQFFHQVIEARSLLFIVLVLLVMTGFFTAIVLSSKYSKPIRELAGSVAAYWSMPGLQGKRKGDLHMVRETIDEVYKSHMNLLEEVDTQRPIVRNQLLMKLLKGHVIHNHEMLAAQSEHFTGTSYFVIYLTLSGCCPAEEYGMMQEKLCDRLSETTFSGATIHALEHLYDYDMILIVCLNGERDQIQAEQGRVFADLQRMFKEDYGIEPGMGIGNMYEDMMKINRSFIEATAAIEYTLKLGNNKPIFFKNIRDYEVQTEWFPVEEQLRFIQSLKQGDRTVALETLDVILDNISSKEQSSLIIKCMCFDVINAALRTYKELDIEEKLTNINQLIQFRTMEDLRENMLEIIDKTCESVQQRKEKNNSQLSESIVAYIQENYNDNNLSLDQISGIFHLSVSYLSRLIKEHTGYTFIECVTNLRMDEIRHRLKHTDDSIKTIIQHAGYYNIPSFNRKFKSLEGVSPGEYRKLYAKSPD